MRHPALSQEPLSLLPATVTLGLDASDSHPDPNHPFFTSPKVERLLISLDRLLSALPHLPFPGLVPNGWPLPRLIYRLARSHPKQGVRLLAWRCWRYWLGHNGFADLGESERAELVWRPPVAEDGLDPNSCPWPSWLDDPSIGAEGLFPEEFICLGEEGTGDWELVKGKHGAELVRRVRRRYVDAWILDPIRQTARTDYLRSVDALGSIYATYAQRDEASDDMPEIIVRPEHLSAFVVELEGYVGIRESCLKPSSFPSPFASASAASTSGYGAATLSSTGVDVRTHFISVPSSLTALRSLASHIAVRLPVVLAGPPSSGKSTLLDHITGQLRGGAGSQRSLVVLNMAARTLDSKSILGSWASDPKEPGRFVFVEGPLVRAMKEGRWLLCEDLDKGSEVSSRLSRHEPFLTRRPGRSDCRELGGRPDATALLPHRRRRLWWPWRRQRSWDRPRLTGRLGVCSSRLRACRDEDDPRGPGQVHGSTVLGDRRVRGTKERGGRRAGPTSLSTVDQRGGCLGGGLEGSREALGVVERKVRIRQACGTARSAPVLRTLLSRFEIDDR